ncbi:hypothetical protein [Woodsholea maritima]|uniref:hypothetical protein n=1 Tax=Woodsholea maritima TaxID=240237 RepID=UPI00037822D0|nr:hypothetical protein [Woodsholea maritima]
MNTRLAILPCAGVCILGAAMMSGKLGEGMAITAFGAAFLLFGGFGITTLIAAHRIKLWVGSLAQIGATSTETQSGAHEDETSPRAH